MKLLTGLPSLITSVAVVLGFIALLAVRSGDFIAASQLIMVCLILDGLDGITARKLHTATRLGAELDTFLDFLAYGVVPAFLVHELLLPVSLPVAWGLSLLTVLSGAFRLARFRVVDPARGEEGYLGMPITVNAGWVAMFVFMTSTGVINDPRFTLREGLIAWCVWGCSVLFLLLQVSTLRYRKPTKAPAVFFLGIVGVLLLFLPGEIAFLSALLLTLYGLYYALVTPFLTARGN